MPEHSIPLPVDRDAERRWKLLPDNSYFWRGLETVHRRGVRWDILSGEPTGRGLVFVQLEGDMRSRLVQRAIEAFRLPPDIGGPLGEVVDGVLLRAGKLHQLRGGDLFKGAGLTETRADIRHHLTDRVSWHRVKRNEAGERVTRKRRKPDVLALEWTDPATGALVRVARPHTVTVHVSNLHANTTEQLEAIFRQAQRLVRVIEGRASLAIEELANLDLYGVAGDPWLRELREFIDIDALPPELQQKLFWAEQRSALARATAGPGAFGRGPSDLADRLRWHWHMHYDGLTAREVADGEADASGNPDEAKIRDAARALDDELKPVMEWPPAV